MRCLTWNVRNAKRWLLASLIIWLDLVQFIVYDLQRTEKEAENCRRFLSYSLFRFLLLKVVDFPPCGSFSKNCSAHNSWCVNSAPRHHTAVRAPLVRHDGQWWSQKQDGDQTQTSSFSGAHSLQLLLSRSATADSGASIPVERAAANLHSDFSSGGIELEENQPWRTRTLRSTRHEG